LRARKLPGKALHSFALFGSRRDGDWIRSTASAPHCQGRPIGAEQCSGLLAERGAVRRNFADQ